MAWELKHPATFVSEKLEPLKQKDKPPTRGILSGAVKVRSAPIVARKSTEVKLLVASQTAVADADGVHVQVDVAVVTVDDIVEPASLASACRYIAVSHPFNLIQSEGYGQTYTSLGRTCRCRCWPSPVASRSHDESPRCWGDQSGRGSRPRP